MRDEPGACVGRPPGNLGRLARSGKGPGGRQSVSARAIVTSGNSSAATIPVALARLVEAGEIPSGAPVLLLGFGAGLAYAGQVVLTP